MLLAREAEIKRLLEYFNEEKEKMLKEIKSLDTLIDSYTTELRDMVHAPIQEEVEE